MPKEVKTVFFNYYFSVLLITSEWCKIILILFKFNFQDDRVEEYLTSDEAEDDNTTLTVSNTK